MTIHHQPPTEDTMTTNQIAPATTAEKLEVVTIPVSDVDRRRPST
jgi:hypothetical protein